MHWKSTFWAVVIGLACSPPTRAGSGYTSVLNPLSFASQGALTLTSGNYTINTSGSAPVLQDGSGNTIFTGTTYNQGGTFDPTISVFDFNSISIGAGVTLTATGSNPLALLSRATTTVNGVLNASGSPGQNGQSNYTVGMGGAGGPGGASGGSGGAPAQPGNGPGAGAGGVGGLAIDSYGVGAGFGGIGGNPGIRPIYGPTYGDLTKALQAGSGGGGSGTEFAGGGGGGGGGGGAVELGALGAITINGQVLADGAKGGDSPLFGYEGGGGSGGGIILDGTTVTVTGTARVSAGGGGYSGGGGRILFLTDSGTADIETTQVSAGGTAYGEPGVISFGQLNPSAVPEPSSAVLVMIGAGAAAYLRRRRVLA